MSIYDVPTNRHIAQAMHTQCLTQTTSRSGSFECNNFVTVGCMQMISSVG